MTNSSLNI